MGTSGSKATNTVSVLNSLAVTATQNTISSCVAASTQSELIAIGNVAGDVKITGVHLSQGSTVNTQCLFTASKTSEINDAVAEALSQQVAASGPAVLSMFGGSRASAKAHIVNQLRTTISQTDVQSAVAQSMQSQAVTIGTVGGNLVIKDVSLAQTAEAVARGIVNSTQMAQAINSVASTIDQAGTAKTQSPYADLLASLANSSMWVIGGILIAIILVIAAPIILLFGGVGALMGRGEESGLIIDLGPEPAAAQ